MILTLRVSPSSIRPFDLSQGPFHFPIILLPRPSRPSRPLFSVSIISLFLRALSSRPSRPLVHSSPFPRFEHPATRIPQPVFRNLVTWNLEPGTLNPHHLYSIPIISATRSPSTAEETMPPA